MRLKNSLVLVLVLLLVAGCSQADKAIVTIDLGLNKQARITAPSLFDRVIAFLSMSSRAEAGEAPYDFETIVITIKGTTSSLEFTYSNSEASPYFNPEMFQYGTLTLALPAEPTTFTVTGYYLTYYDDTEYRAMKYLGATAVALSPGEQSVNIVMEGPYPAMPYLSASMEGPNVYLDFYANTESGGPIDEFIIYRTTDPKKRYTEVHRTSEPGYWYDHDVISGTTYYYKIVTINSYGLSTPYYTSYYYLYEP